MKTIMFDKIATVICNDYHIEFTNLQSTSRKEELVYARQLIMFLSVKLQLGTLTEIGSYFNRDHATVIHAVKCIDNYKFADIIKKKTILNYEKKFESIKIINQKLGVFDREIELIKHEINVLELRFNDVNEKVTMLIYQIRNMKL